MDLAHLIQHPELMNKETLFELRNLVALYPYYQPARLLMLQNMYLLHDSAFDDELRRAALYVCDRSLLFEMVEGAHYKIKTAAEIAAENAARRKEAEARTDNADANRTMSIIDNFIESGADKASDDTADDTRRPTPADAAIDYVAYLLKSETDEERAADEQPQPQMKGQDLIDDFINKDGGKIQLQEKPTYRPENTGGGKGQDDTDEDYFTETLAKIYIKQGRYSKALEIIQRLNLNYPKKSAYFADQIRFLKKLIINEKARKSQQNKENEPNDPKVQKDQKENNK